MTASYDDAVTELYQAPHPGFVNERKRLAAALKAAGDKDGAARLAKLPRPPVSAWAVNQLWWHARDAFDAMLATAARLRDGDLSATAAHRETLGKLRARASAILSDAGHTPSEATLRRVTTTLSAIAATGSFAPDPPGALAEDRDPPGFETMGLVAVAPAPPAPPSATPAPPSATPAPPSATPAPPSAEPAPPISDADSDLAAADAEVAAAKAAAAKAAAEAEAAAARAAAAAAEVARREAAAEQRRREEAAARKQAERNRVEAALRTAVGEVEHRQRELTRLRDAIADAEAKLEQSRAIVTDLEARLAGLA